MPSTTLEQLESEVPFPHDGVASSEPRTAVTRVLHAINGEHYAGAERVQDLLAEQLAPLGFQVGFACLKPDLFPRCRFARHAPLHALPMARRADLRVAWQMSRLVRRDGYRLIHAHTPRSLMIGSIAARLARVPLVYHVHSPTAQDSTRRGQNWINYWCERISLRGVAALIPVSQSLGRRMLWAGYHDHQVQVVPNGVPAPTARRSSDPPCTGWTLGTVALFRPRKGLEVLLEAIAILRRQRVAVRLLAVGPFETPEYERAIRQQTARLGLQEVVRWTGFTSDMASQLTQMDLFVLPSLFGEGLPMVVLEAMAAGVPIVGTRVEGVPEAIEDGVNGVLAQPGDQADLARAISRVVHGQVDWSRMRANGLRRHRDEFSDEQMARGVAAVYRRVLQG